MVNLCRSCDSVLDTFSISRGDSGLCRGCYAVYKRRQLASNRVARNKQNVRSQARHALKKGLIFKHPCSCGSTDSEMHHPDYSKPLDVVWYCTPCHAEFHNIERKALLSLR